MSVIAANLTLTIVLLAAVRYDLKYRVIPNWLTFGATAVGLSLALFLSGSSGLVGHLWGAAITGGVWFLFWQLGFMGGGDQKLMLAVGALVGRDSVALIIVCVALAGGVQAIGTLLWRRWRLGTPAPIGWPAETRQRRGWRGVAMPYSFAIAAGTGATMLLNYFGVSLLLF